VAIWAVALALGERMPGLSAPRGPRLWAHMVGFAIFSNALPFLLISWGQQYVTSAFAGISMAVVPLFTLALAHFLIAGERLNGPRIAGFVLGLAGVGVLIGPGVFSSSGQPLEDLGRLALIASAASYAVGSMNTRLCPPIGLLPYSAGGLLIATAMLLPWALIAEGVPTLSGAAPTLALVYLGLGSTALATLLLVRVIRRAGPTFLTQVNYHVPVWSVALGVTVLGEAAEWSFFLALGLILAGLAVTRARPGVLGIWLGRRRG